MRMCKIVTTHIIDEIVLDHHMRLCKIPTMSFVCLILFSTKIFHFKAIFIFDKLSLLFYTIIFISYVKIQLF